MEQIFDTFTLEKLIEEKKNLIGKYIGDWNKPASYYVMLKNLDDAISKKTVLEYGKNKNTSSI